MAGVMAIAAYGAWKAQPPATAEGLPPVYVPQVKEMRHMQAIIVNPVHSPSGIRL